MENKTAVAVKEAGPVERRSPADLISAAVGSGADLEKLKDLLALQKEWEANEARKAYHQAMAAFKANPPQIYKDSHVKFQTSKGTTEYKHASLANVCDKIGKALSPHGLSASWVTKQDGAKVSVTCRVTHASGHYEETTLSANPDDSGSKNQIQAIGSTVTYLQRYTLLALTGLATEEQDNDANAGPVELITEEQAVIINEYISSTKANVPAFLGYMGIESVEKMPKAKYQQAIALFKEKERKKEKGVAK